METKKCSKCKQIKSLNLFGFDKKRKDNLTCRCKECINQYYLENKQAKKDYYENNKEEINKKNKKYCQIPKIKERKKDYNKKYSKKEEVKEKLKLYYQKPEVKERINNKAKQKRNNSLYKLQSNIRTAIATLVREKEVNKTKSTLKIIGIDNWSLLKEHLEKQFTEGMTWDNWGVGKNNETWHIDHIIPTSSAKTEEEVFKLNHYTNLRPMWCSDNIRKSNKL
jgi:hypothetical protein